MLAALRRRDGQEVEAFALVIRSYATVLAASTAAQKQLVEHRRRADELQSANEAMQHELGKVADQGGQIVDTAKVNMLEDRIAELQQERGDLYQKQATQSNRMLEMSSAVEDAEATTRRYKDQIDGLQDQITGKQAEIAQLNSALDTVNLQSSDWQNKAELLGGNLEELRGKHEELRRLHEELVGRWVAKSEELGQLHNELNQARKKLQEDIRAFQLLEAMRRDQGTAGEAGVDITASGIDNEFFTPSGFAQVPKTLKTVLKAHTKDAYMVSYNHNTGAHFTSCGSDKYLKVWQVMGLREGGENHTIRQPQAVLSVAWSSDDSMLITGGADNSVRLYQANTGKEKRVYSGHRDKVYNAKCFPDCHHAVSVSHDRSVKYWDLDSSGRCLSTFLSTSMINDVDVPRDGMLACTAHFDGSIRFFDPRTKQEVQKMQVHENHVSSVSYLPDSSRLVTASRDNALKLIDVRMYGELCALRSPEFRNSSSNNKCAVSPDGKYVAAGSQSGAVLIWDLQTSEQVTSLIGAECPKEQSYSCSWSPNGQELAMSDRAGNLVIWTC